MSSTPQTATAANAEVMSRIGEYLAGRSSASLADIHFAVPTSEGEKVTVCLQIMRGWNLVRYDAHQRRWLLVSDAYEREIRSRIRTVANPSSPKHAGISELAAARERVLQILEGGRERTIAELSELTGTELSDANLQQMVRKGRLSIVVREGVRLYRRPVTQMHAVSTIDLITAGMASLGAAGAV